LPRRVMFCPDGRRKETSEICEHHCKHDPERPRCAVWEVETPPCVRAWHPQISPWNLEHHSQLSERKITLVTVNWR
jgi:hypothetical protein